MIRVGTALWLILVECLIVAAAWSFAPWGIAATLTPGALLWAALTLALLTLPVVVVVGRRSRLARPHNPNAPSTWSQPWLTLREGDCT